MLYAKKLHLLLGKWTGSEKISSFEYFEETEFNWDKHNDLIHYEQRTWDKKTGLPLHWESGFIKPIDSEGVDHFEISNAQDSGRVEILKGRYSKDKNIHRLHLNSKVLANDSRMVMSERIFAIDNNKLSYIMKMSTNNIEEHQQHLKAELIKI